jgi:hypothetical protein
MQLAAAGRWKLSDDVNRYLPAAARLDDGFGRQVTIADLLTHTAGFEDKFAGAITLQSDSISLANFFAHNRPRRVRPPGTEVSYSNIGIALLGYAVQVASEESFDAYVATHIFAPLGMTRSTFAQPPSADWVNDQADRSSMSARAIAFVPYPAASLVTTPSDMGRFMAAHLSGGALGGARILSVEMADDMHASHWRPQPSVPAVAFGFFEGDMNGHRTLFHTGDSGDHSLVLLLPDDGVGFYFVYGGSDEQTVVREKLARAIVDRYSPSVTTPPPVLSGAQNVAALAGRYRGAAFSRSNYEKLKATLYQMNVRAALRVHRSGCRVPRWRSTAGVLARARTGMSAATRRHHGNSDRGGKSPSFSQNPATRRSRRCHSPPDS